MLFKNSVRIFVTLLLFLLFGNFVLADDVSFNFYKENYKSFETVQVNVDIGNISLSRDLEVPNLVLLRPDNTSVNIAKNKIKVNNNFYVFYFDLPALEEGQYILKLVNVNYIKDGVLKIGSFSRSFNILNGSSQLISVRPGYVLSYVISSQEAPFSLVITNKGNDIVSIGLSKEGDFFSLRQNSFNLVPSSSKTVSVSTLIFNRNEAAFNGLINVNYAGGSYTIPFVVVKTDFIASSTNESANTINVSSNINNNTLIGVSNTLYLTTLSDRLLNNLSVDITVGEYYPSGQIVVKNNAGSDLHNLNYYISGDILGIFDITPVKADIIKINESAVFLLGINNSYDLRAGTYGGFLNVNSSEGASVSIPITVNVFAAPVVNYTTNFTRQPATNATPIVNLPPEQKKGINVWLILLLVILIFVFILYFIYKRTKPKKEEFESFVDKVKSRRNY